MGNMGSKIMHLVIANRIAECLSIEDRTSFLLGSIAPDAVSPKNLYSLNKDIHSIATGSIREETIC